MLTFADNRINALPDLLPLDIKKNILSFCSYELINKTRIKYNSEDYDDSTDLVDIMIDSFKDQLNSITTIEPLLENINAILVNIEEFMFARTHTYRLNVIQDHIVSVLKNKIAIVYNAPQKFSIYNDAMYKYYKSVLINEYSSAIIIESSDVWDILDYLNELEFLENCTSLTTGIYRLKWYKVDSLSPYKKDNIIMCVDINYEST